MAWTNWPMFTVGLVKRGYSDGDIQKVLGGNVLRVLRAVFPQQEVRKYSQDGSHGEAIATVPRIL